MLREIRRKVRRFIRHARERAQPRPAAPPADPAESVKHDGYAQIRPRRPGEDTGVGLRPVDITVPGPQLAPVKDDDDEKGA
jgi:hypothetical protein